MTDGDLTAAPDIPATLTPAADADTGVTPTAPVGAHNSLGGRDADDAHPIGAIGGLPEALQALEDAIGEVETGGGVQLGETSTTAHRGDHGAQAYGHLADTDNPHGVTAAQVGAATSAQGALADTAVQPADLADVATTGAYSDLTGTPDLSLKANASHTHPQSDITGLIDDLTAKASTAYVDAELSAKANQVYVDAGFATVATELAGKAPATHTHAQSSITGLVDALAAKAPTTVTDSHATRLTTLENRTWWKIKQADEPRTTTTQSADGEMALALPANSMVRIDVSFLVAGGIAADIDIDLDIGTATLGSSGVRGHVQGWSGAAFANITNPPPITPGTPVWVGTGTTQDAEIVVWAVLTTTTATTVRPRWAQHVATGTTTVRKGSMIAARI